MKQNDFLNIIPFQYTGKDILTEATLALKNPAEAKLFYNLARKRLLHINNWHSVAGFISGTFQISNERAERFEREVREGDYIKIDIPGPAGSEGDGYDWVLVEELKEMNGELEQGTGFRVRPSANPLNEKEQTAHFYSSEATSTFIVTRKNTIVTVQIIDLNLHPNKEINSVTDRIRNLAVGVGALGLFSKVQWKNLADGILKKEEE